jgi:CheY-like chemotaxis protein/DNA-directed RNA polymerase specialized sigma24 family protein
VRAATKNAARTIAPVEPSKQLSNMVQPMSISNSIAPHLPYLRRFARALTGSQKAGDAYVVATLEALVAEPALMPPDIAPRAALYKTFLGVWNSRDLNSSTFGTDTGARSAAEKNLEALTPVSRQAFLLMSVEGFSAQDVATILNKTADDVARLVDTIGREIADQVATEVLIIEDEPLIAMDLKDLVEGLGHRVTGTARTHREAVAAFAAQQPGLILADIQLADGSSGLNAVNEILTSFDIPVIFITAFPERLLTGERPEPTFLITKPFEPGVVKALISQALFFETRAQLKRKALELPRTR